MEPAGTAWGSTRSSRYVSGSDGVRLAVDVHRPAVSGQPAAGPFPAILVSTRYQRRRTAPSLGDVDFVANGYVVVVVDQRGTGASFGTRRGDYAPEEAQDNAAVVEWVAAQPWCSGRVAMMGVSYLGITQYLTAALAPRGLVAIAPTVASFDAYDRTHPNGVWIPQEFIRERTRPMDLGLPPYDGPMSVDDDPDGVELAAAREEHRGNLYPDDLLVAGMCRDSVVDRLGYAPGVVSDPMAHRDAIRGSGVALLHVAGWFDGAVASQLAAFRDLGGRIVIGPWTHWGVDPEVSGPEHLRFFDRVLKGVESKDEEPVRYVTINEEPGLEWRSAVTWPVPGTVTRMLHLAPGAPGDEPSSGVLASSPAPGDTRHHHVVDRSVAAFDGTYDKLARTWSGDLRGSLRGRGLDYTTAPLVEAVRVTGHPVLHLELSATGTDAYIFAFLEDVSPDGTSRYVSDGVLRASHRAEAPDHEPWRGLGVPFHRGLRRDVTPLRPGEPERLAFGLFPTSYVFPAGHRIGLTVTGANEGYYPTPDDLRQQPDLALTLHLGPGCFLRLPVVGSVVEPRAQRRWPGE